METRARTGQIGDQTTSGTQKLLNLFFIVDISGSMRFHGRIEAVNEAFEQMIPELQKLQKESQSEFELRIAIMTFDQHARWIVDPTPILEYHHEEIQCSQWVTYFSAAFRTLGEKLSRSEYMAHQGKVAQPYIMLLTDGEPTKDDDYQPELDKLLENSWFTQSQRFAVLIGEDTINSPAAREAVGKFVTNPGEGIINAADAVAIAAEVQAKTIHTVVNMTKHQVAPDSPDPEIPGGTFPDDDGGWPEPDWDWPDSDGNYDDVPGFDNGSFL